VKWPKKQSGFITKILLPPHTLWLVLWHGAYVIGRLSVEKMVKQLQVRLENAEIASACTESDCAHNLNMKKRE
jgi:hypothetical protein